MTQVTLPEPNFEVQEAKFARVKFYQNVAKEKNPFVRFRFNHSAQTLLKINNKVRFIPVISKGPYIRNSSSSVYECRLIRTTDPKEGFAVYNNTSQFVSIDDTHSLSEIKIQNRVKNIWFDLQNVKLLDTGDITFIFRV